jgi:hypothetical protein
MVAGSNPARGANAHGHQRLSIPILSSQISELDYPLPPNMLQKRPPKAAFSSPACKSVPVLMPGAALLRESPHRIEAATVCRAARSGQALLIGRKLAIAGVTGLTALQAVGVLLRAGGGRRNGPGNRQCGNSQNGTGNISAHITSPEYLTSACKRWCMLANRMFNDGSGRWFAGGELIRCHVSSAASPAFRRGPVGNISDAFSIAGHDRPAPAAQRRSNQTGLSRIPATLGAAADSRASS